MAILDLNNIKDQVQTALADANTTTAATDLSGSLTTKIQRVMQVNPGRIPVQSTWYPFVTAFIQNKSVEHPMTNQSQSRTLRKSVVQLKVLGAVWNSTISDLNQDAADDECEVLMENIEQILRESPSLAKAVDWHIIPTTTYHNAALDEGSSLRVGELTLECHAFYTVPKTVPALPDKAGIFDGSSHIEFPDSDDFSPVTALTVLMWVKFTTGGFQTLLSKYGSAAEGYREWTMTTNGSGQMGIIITNSLSCNASSCRKVYTDTVSVGDDATHLIGFSWAANALTLYRDGSPVANPTKSADATVNSVPNGPGRLLVGAQAVSPSASAEASFYTGNADDIVVFKATLDDAGVAAIWNSGAGKTDLTAHANAADLKLHLKLDDNITDSSSEGHTGTNAGVTFENTFI